MALTAVSLEDILVARERRSGRMRTLLEEYRLPVLCFTLNIAGEVKNSPSIELAFLEGVKRIKALCTPVHEELNSFPTGCEGLFSVDMEAPALKALCVGIEEQDPLGRLFDMEVFDTEENRMERGEGHPRPCLVCGGPVSDCARNRAHDAAAIKTAVEEILESHVCRLYGGMAVECLKEEALLSPKPGLVDPSSNGAHEDMTVETLLLSAEALRGYFENAVRLGLQKAKTDTDELHIMRALRKLGLKAETEMLEVTGGVNTHKGGIYALGLLCCGWGLCLGRGWGRPAETAASLVQTDICGEFLRARAIPKTHGEALYATGGFTGARGEAAEAFPHGKKAAEWLRKYKDEPNGALFALLHIMAELMDTNILYRGGREGLRYVQEEARKICELPLGEREAAARELDAELTKRNLSPGGAADMLAVGLFLNRIAIDE